MTDNDYSLSGGRQERVKDAATCMTDNDYSLSGGRQARVKDAVTCMTDNDCDCEPMRFRIKPWKRLHPEKQRLLLWI